MLGSKRFRSALCPLALVLVLGAFFLLDTQLAVQSFPGLNPPSPPSATHWLGTDDQGRDVAARLFFGLGNSLLFGLLTWAGTAVVGYGWGMAQGLLGGKSDLWMQRLTEIWTTLPCFIILMLCFELRPPSFTDLVLFWVAFGWVGLSRYARAETLRLRSLPFTEAARAMGTSPLRLAFRHILPNSLTPLLSLTPALIGSAITGLAALDYLGLGLAAPTPSLGELLRQGQNNLSCWWLSAVPVCVLATTLLTVTWIGERLRRAVDVRGSG